MAEFSPMMQHYLETKEKYKDCILFYRLGDFYEMFFEDAKIAATLLDKAGGTVNSSRGILCAWKKDSFLDSKREEGTLSLDDIAASAAKAALESKTELLSAKAQLQ